jgi:hypothetical protein
VHQHHLASDSVVQTWQNDGSPAFILSLTFIIAITAARALYSGKGRAGGGMKRRRQGRQEKAGEGGGRQEGGKRRQRMVWEGKGDKRGGNRRQGESRESRAGRGRHRSLGEDEETEEAEEAGVGRAQGEAGGGRGREG